MLICGNSRVLPRGRELRPRLPVEIPWGLERLPRMVMLYYVKDWGLLRPVSSQPVTAITFTGCSVISEIMKRTKMTRTPFDIKRLPRPKDT